MRKYVCYFLFICLANKRIHLREGKELLPHLCVFLKSLELCRVLWKTETEATQISCTTVQIQCFMSKPKPSSTTFDFSLTSLLLQDEAPLIIYTMPDNKSVCRWIGKVPVDFTWGTDKVIFLSLEVLKSLLDV